MMNFRFLEGMLLSVLLFESVVMPATANNLAKKFTFSNVDLITAGAGLRATASARSTDTTAITLSGIGSSTVLKAYLYYQGISNGPADIGVNSLLHGEAVLSEPIGSSSSNCWPDFSQSDAYRADVTSIVDEYKDDVYEFKSLASLAQFQGNGVSLVVLFTDNDSSNNKDVVIYDGNDSNIANPFDALGWNIVLNNIECPAVCTAALEMHVGDGQTIFLDDKIKVNSIELVPAGPIFQGTSVPPSPFRQDGNLWDIRSFDITSFLTPSAENSLSIISGTNQDCLSIVVAIITLPAGAAPGLELDTQGTVDACVGEETSAQVTVTDTEGNLVIGLSVELQFFSGEFEDQVFTAVSDATGVATFVLPVPTVAGTSTFQLCAVNVDGQKFCSSSELVAIDCNSPPYCSNAAPSKAILWPPNHQFRAITIGGVTDIDGDSLTIEIKSIFSDEATATAKGAGGVTHSPDASGVGSSTAQVRAERSGVAPHNGRVYHIAFVASDGNGGSCSGIVKVGVPHDKKDTPVDDGPLFDATF